VKARALSCTILVCSTLTLPGVAGTVSLRPIADTTVQELLPDSNFGDGTSFTSGGRRGGGITRGLLEFDIAGNLPAGAIINSASLSLTVVRTPSFGVASVFDLNRLLASWAEGNGSDMAGSLGVAGATWNNRFGTAGSPWATPGGDFAATISGSRAIAGSGPYTFTSNPFMITDVQSWLDNPATNFGWLLRSESEASSTTIRRFGSREDALNSPILTLNYTVVPEPGSLRLGILAWFVLANLAATVRKKAVKTP